MFFAHYLLLGWLLGVLPAAEASDTGSKATTASGPATAAAGTYHNVMRYGAVGDGKTKDTKAIQKAIDTVNESGGGIVYFPPGLYHSGTLYLRNHVTLYLSSGAVLLGSTNLEDYPSNEPSVRSYTDNYVHQSLIAGENLHHVAITGHGTIKGRGSDRAFAASAPDWSYRKRPYLIRLVSCRDVLVENVTLRDSAMWVQHYLACENLTIRGITVRSRCNSNNDGIDIDCCRNVRVIGCDISSGDDALCLKSTADRPCENVVVSDCVLSSACNGFKLGTESNGGFRNITLTNCTMYDVNLAGIVLLMVDGGTLDGVTVSNVTMRNVDTPIFLRLGNRARPFKPNMAPPGVGRLGNVTISNVIATGCRRIPSSIVGLPDHPIENVIVSNINLTCEGGVSAPQASANIPENPSGYPEHNMFGVLPAHGFYCRHVAGLTLRDVTLQWIKPDLRSAMVFDDVRDLSVSGLRTPAASEGGAVLTLKAVRGALIGGCVVPAEASTFARIEPGSQRLSFVGNDLAATDRPFEFGEQLLAKELFETANRIRKAPPASAPAATATP